MAGLFTNLGVFMKLSVVLFLIFFTLGLSAQEHTLQESEYKYVQKSIGKGKPYFLEVGAESCRSCQIMGDMLYRVKVKHPEYNIHFINVKKERKVAVELKIRMIPTQIIYDKNGEEVYRHIGVLGSEELSTLFKKYSF